MYVYDYNSILTMEIKNRSDKEIIRAFAEFSKSLKYVESTHDYISWTTNHQERQKWQ